MIPARHLVVFVRAPRLGRVKTRLAADIGSVAAWAFYRRAVDAARRRLAGDGRWQCWVAVTPDHEARPGRPWTRGCRVMPQGGGDLGDRMGRVMHRLPPGPAVIVGTDVPGLRPAHVAAGFRALGGNDAVFGPSSDGGYWLVGLRRRPTIPDLFRGVRWSTEHALADTLANLPPGRTAALLETLDDVDDGAAWRRWRASRRRL